MGLFIQLLLRFSRTLSLPPMAGFFAGWVWGVAVHVGFELLGGVFGVFGHAEGCVQGVEGLGVVACPGEPFACRGLLGAGEGAGVLFEGVEILGEVAGLFPGSLLLGEHLRSVCFAGGEDGLVVGGLPAALVFLCFAFAF